MNKFKTLHLLNIIIAFAACNAQSDNYKNKISPTFSNQKKTVVIHCTNSEDTTKNCTCPSQFELNDSLKLKHIKNQFYKSETGHLYEKTWSQRYLNGQDTLSWVIYFNGYFSQDVDPITFEQLDGWYAKDKNNVYYYRPVSGGMLIIKIDSADPKTFKILSGHYKYAMDKKFFYNENQIIESFIASKTTLKIDNKKRVIKMTCNNKNYKFETVN